MATGEIALAKDEKREKEEKTTIYQAHNKARGFNKSSSKQG